MAKMIFSITSGVFFNCTITNPRAIMIMIHLMGLTTQVPSKHTPDFFTC
jgi:hypothetical protein